MGKLKKTILTSGMQLVITAITFGFGVLMAYYYGASSQMDVYVVSSSIIGVIITLLIGTQPRVFTPFLAEVSSNNSYEEETRTATNIIEFNNVVFLIVTLFIVILSYPLMKIFAPGLDHSELLLGSKLLKISALFLFVSNFTSLGKSIIEYQAYPMLSQGIRIIQSIFLLALFFILNEFVGIFSLPLSQFISVVLTIPIYLIFLRRKKFPLFSHKKLWNSDVKKYLLLIIPIFSAEILTRVIKLSDSFLASFLTEGSLSHISYSLKIVNSLQLLFMGITIVYFPILSKLNTKEQDEEHFMVFKSGFQTLFLVSLGLMGFMVLFSPQIIQIVFERGSFTHTDTLSVANLLRAYCFMILCAPIGSYLANIYYSRKKAGLATIYSLISSITNIVLNFIFVIYWGVYGLAIASSISFLLGNILQFSNLRKANSTFALQELLLDVFKSVVVIGLSSGGVLLFSRYVISFQSEGILGQLGFVFVMLVIYTLLAFFFSILLKFKIAMIAIKQAKKIISK